MRLHSVRDAPGLRYGIRDTVALQGARFALACTMRSLIRMDNLSRWLVTHPPQVRLAWLLLFVLLAACNNNSDGGANGY